ncbi:MAG: hypothetical protein WB677_17915 [Xanthobacteraceae bacterium]
MAFDNGDRKKPSAERGPNASAAIRQPHMMMTAGVRQPAVLDATACDVIEFNEFGAADAAAARNEFSAMAIPTK